MFQILKTYFTKKVQANIIFQYQRNRPKRDPKFGLPSDIILKFETYFFLCNSTSSIQPSQKKKKNSAEILNSGHMTYTGNTLKFQYLGEMHAKGR